MIRPFFFKCTLPIIAVLAMLTVDTSAQIGGIGIFEFQNLSVSARTTALGGTLISVVDDDVALGFQNPAVLNSAANDQISFQHNMYAANIQQGFAGYSHYFKQRDFTVAAGFRYASYGSFVLADETGQQLGTFKANDMSFQASAGKKISEHTSIGASLRFLNSNLESYHATGVAVDLGANYADTTHKIDVAVVLKNIGTELSSYSGTNERMPVDLQIAFSKQLKYLPFRFTVTGHHLHQWDIRYDDPNSPLQEAALFGEVQQTTSGAMKVVDNVFRHLIFSGEFLIGAKENFRLRIGYNHLRRAELQVKGTRSMAGISFGFGLKISKFRIDYGFASYHLTGGVHHLGISTSLSNFK